MSNSSCGAVKGLLGLTMILFGRFVLSPIISSAKGEPVMSAISRLIPPHEFTLNVSAEVSLKSSQSLGAWFCFFNSAVMTVELPEMYIVLSF